MESGQIAGLTKAINANDIGNLGMSTLEAIVKGLDSEHLSLLGEEKGAEIFQGVGDSTVISLPPDNKEAVLDALGANYLGTGAKTFGEIAGGNTVFDSALFETPPELLDVLKDNAFGNLFGGS